MIAIALPTRGLLFIRTLNSLKRNGLSLDNLFIADGFAIPESHNKAVEMAMGHNSEYILMVEDDIDFPAGTINKLKELDVDVAYADYPVNNGTSTVCKVKDEVYWGGLGCTLIKRKVFETIGYPYFTVDHSWLVERDFKLTKLENKAKYGGHDINFGMQCRELGFTLKKVENFEIKHLRCEQLQRSENNHGIYEIEALPPISKFQIH